LRHRPFLDALRVGVDGVEARGRYRGAGADNRGGDPPVLTLRVSLGAGRQVYLTALGSGGTFAPAPRLPRLCPQ